MSSVSENLELVQAQIKAAASGADRLPSSVCLVAVSKRQSTERISEALKAGIRVFGENRVQEAYEHWDELRGAYEDLRLHLVGPLQTNKAREAVALFDVIETLDRQKLARILADEMAAQGKDLPCYIQVNTGAEPQKNGVLAAALPEFYDFCYTQCGLNIAGLMCIPPVDDDPEKHFKILANLAADLGLTELSMGMSGDYEAAIACGATSIRVGTALFGTRDTI